MNVLWGRQNNWPLSAVYVVVLLLGLSALSIALLYGLQPESHVWAWHQLLHCLLGISVFFCILQIPSSFFYRSAYWGYACMLCCLIIVNIMGHIGMGARRWLEIGFFHFQPAELMKLSLILALARYCDQTSRGGLHSISGFLIPVVLILLPTISVLKEPDLGTGLLILCLGLAVLFFAGLSYHLFFSMFGFVLVALPVLWYFYFADYQKKRIFTFLDPYADPLGAGYHTLQAMIAVGSGGHFGKGWGLGTQSHLKFLPEMQTDFIFTVFAEEFGFAGCFLLVVALFGLVVLCIQLGSVIRWSFGRLVVMGVAANFFISSFVNMLMNTGFLPVVGVPLPLMSYGGTIMLTTYAGFGILLNIVLKNNSLNNGV